MIISSGRVLKFVPRDHPDGGVPQHYIVDGAAEYVPGYIQELIMMLGREICYCAPAPPNHKPYVELFFASCAKN